MGALAEFEGDLWDHPEMYLHSDLIQPTCAIMTGQGTDLTMCHTGVVGQMLQGSKRVEPSDITGGHDSRLIGRGNEDEGVGKQPLGMEPGEEMQLAVIEAVA